MENGQTVRSPGEYQSDNDDKRIIRERNGVSPGFFEMYALRTKMSGSSKDVVRFLTDNK